MATADGAMAIPGWVPPTLNPHVASVDPGEQRLGLRAGREQITFEEVPADWHITITATTGRPVTIECQQPGHGVTWELSGFRGRTVTLGAGLSDVTIQNRASNQTILELAADGITLTLGPGNYQVNDQPGGDVPITYSVRTGSKGSGSRVVLSGTAALSDLNAGGNVDLQMPIADAELTVAGAITAVKLEHVRVQLTATPNNGRGKAGPSVDARAATDCSFSGPGAVKVGAVNEGVTVAAATSFTATGELSGLVDIESAAVAVSSISGCGVVRSGTSSREATYPAQTTA